METNTKQNLSLVERFEKEGGNNRYSNSVICDLEGLLKCQVLGDLTAEQEDLLSTYQETFEWQEEWTLQSTWCLNGTLDMTYECLHKDDVIGFLNEEHELPKPESQDDGYLEIDDFYDGWCFSPYVTIDQMKVKKQLVKQQFMVTIEMPPESLPGEEEVDLQSSLQSCISDHIISSHGKKDCMVKVELHSEVI